MLFVVVLYHMCETTVTDTLESNRIFYGRLNLSFLEFVCKMYNNSQNSDKKNENFNLLSSLPQICNTITVML
jgi:hypothetical protein